MIRKTRGGSIEELKLQKEGERGKRPEYILADLLQV
jgi:hypothetical protein